LRVNWREVEGEDLSNGWNTKSRIYARWRQNAVDKEEEASVIKKAKALRGLYSQGVSN